MWRFCYMFIRFVYPQWLMLILIKCCKFWCKTLIRYKCQSLYMKLCKMLVFVRITCTLATSYRASIEFANKIVVVTFIFTILYISHMISVYQDRLLIYLLFMTHHNLSLRMFPRVIL